MGTLLSRLLLAFRAFFVLTDYYLFAHKEVCKMARTVGIDLGTTNSAVAFN